MNYRQMTTTLLVCGALTVLVACPSIRKMESRPDASVPARDILVIGHRGAAGLAPENTLAAFARALDLGVDAVELDVHLAKDGTVVVYHDFTLKPEITRTPDGKWLDMWDGKAIRELSLARLKSYDVGRLDPYSSYAGRYPDQQPVDGESIPTLREVIELMRARTDGRTELWIEIKTSPVKPQVSSRPEALAEAVVDLLRRESFVRAVKILCFDWRALAHVERIAPEMATVYLTSTSLRLNTLQRGLPGPSPWTAGFDIDRYKGSIPHLVAAAGGSRWAPRHNRITAEDVAAAHRLNIEVFVWTPDAEAEMLRSIEMGVDGIITNRPDRLNAILSRRYN